MNTKNILLGILLIVMFVAGFVLGRLTVPTGATTMKEAFSDVVPAAVDNNTTTATDETAASATTTTSSEVTTPVSVGASMTASQRQMLTSFGLDPDKITITADMVACAEAKVGTARIEQIKNGATPSFLEGAALLACYSQ